MRGRGDLAQAGGVGGTPAQPRAGRVGDPSVVLAGLGTLLHPWGLQGWGDTRLAMGLA